MTTRVSSKAVGWCRFEAYTERLMENHHIPGVAVAVSENGQIMYSNGFGYRDLRNRLPVTPETIFGIASVSKSFTALAILQLQEKGKLSVDDPVVKYLPEWKIPGLKDVNMVKIYHLLSHTSGIPPLRRSENLIRFSEHLQFFTTQEYQLLGYPGDYLSYSNDSFLLLGEIIQRLSGKLYRRYMTSNVLELLEMNRSTYSVEELFRFDDVTVPYEFNSGSSAFEEVKWPQLGNYEVGGGVRSNVLDLMKYGQIYINRGVVDGERIVSSEGILRMQGPVYMISRKRYYGLALEITPDHSGVTLIEHGGSQPGVSSNFGFVPERNMVVSVLTNVSGAPAESIWLAAANTALGLPLEQKREAESTCKISLDDLQKFCGTYQSNEGLESSTLTVFPADDCLRVRIAEEDYILQAASNDSLSFNKNGLNKVVKFHFDATGRPWAAFFNLRMLRRVS